MQQLKSRAQNAKRSDGYNLKLIADRDSRMQKNSKTNQPTLYNLF